MTVSCVSGRTIRYALGQGLKETSVIPRPQNRASLPVCLLNQR